jgi:hypothetical protein
MLRLAANIHRDGGLLGPEEVSRELVCTPTGTWLRNRQSTNRPRVRFRAVATDGALELPLV